jgi:signal transduction histidine kinase
VFVPLFALYARVRDRICALKPGASDLTVKADGADVKDSVENLLAPYRDQLHKSADHRFGWLLLIQWLLWVAFAPSIAAQPPSGPLSPLSGLFGSTWAPVFLGGIVLLPAGYLIARHAGKVETRFVIAVVQGLTTLLLAVSMGGRLESCFHALASLAFLSIYRDWRVLAIMTALAAAVPGLVAALPGVVADGFASGHGWRWLEYEGWLIFETVFLGWFCLQSRKEIYAVAEKQAQLAAINKTLDEQAVQRTEEVARLQAELAQADKMASLGQLAAGLAHEINNPLGFVMSNLNTLNRYVGTLKSVLAEYRRFADTLRKTDSHGEHEEEIRRIRLLEDEERLAFILNDLESLLLESREGTVRVKVIVQGLRNFARLNDSLVQACDINAGLQDTLKIVQNDLKPSCDIVLDLGDLPLLRCQGGQLNQAFLNVLTNAFQATPENGEIRIRTRAEESHIVITVRDTGVGIASDAMDRIFDPFFTTRPVGQGTGLGLAIAYGIITKHQGTIDVASEVGRGSIFTIRLPLFPDPVGADIGSAAFPGEGGQSVSRVLVGGV